MSRFSYRFNLKKLINENINDLKKDAKLLEQIEKRIESNYIKKFTEVGEKVK